MLTVAEFRAAINATADDNFWKELVANGPLHLDCTPIVAVNAREGSIPPTIPPTDPDASRAVGLAHLQLAAQELAEQIRDDDLVAFPGLRDTKTT